MLVSIQRTASIGDVIMALPVAQRLHEAGHAVEWITAPECAEVILGHPAITKLRRHNALIPAMVPLDGLYEYHDQQTRQTQPVPHLFMDAAVLALKGFGIRLQEPFSDLRPRLYLDEIERNAAAEMIQPFSLAPARIAVIPRSNAWANRTVVNESWEEFSRHVGTKAFCFWTGTEQAPPGFVDLRIRSLRKLMGLLSVVDLAVSVDTGPMHMAAALGTPLLCIKQAVDPKLRLDPTVRFETYKEGLLCLNCHLWKCPLNSEAPPCSKVDGVALANKALILLERN